MKKLILLITLSLIGCAKYEPPGMVCVEYHMEPNMGTKQRQPPEVCDKYIPLVHNKSKDKH